MEKKAFGQWIDGLPFAKYDKVRRRIVAECKVSGAAFSLWRRGVNAPRPWPATSSTASPWKRRGGPCTARPPQPLKGKPYPPPLKGAAHPHGKPPSGGWG